MDDSPRKDDNPLRPTSREDLPANRPVWGRGRPVLTPMLGVLLMVLVVVVVFAAITFARWNT